GAALPPRQPVCVSRGPTLASPATAAHRRRPRFHSQADFLGSGIWAILPIVLEAAANCLLLGESRWLSSADAHSPVSERVASPRFPVCPVFLLGDRRHGQFSFAQRSQSKS